jgi:hypothetical protein
MIWSACWDHTGNLFIRANEGLGIVITTWFSPSPPHRDRREQVPIFSIENRLHHASNFKLFSLVNVLHLWKARLSVSKIWKVS